MLKIAKYKNCIFYSSTKAKGNIKLKKGFCIAPDINKNSLKSMNNCDSFLPNYL